MSLVPLQARLAQLDDEYAVLAERHHNIECRQGFVEKDFFSLEPFFLELNTINPDSIQIYPAQEQVPSDEVIVCGIRDGRVIFCREFMGAETYYDSFFEYEGDITRRLWCFVRDGEVGNRCIEELQRAEDGFPISFKRFGYFGNESTTYERVESGVSAKGQYFDENLEAYRDFGREIELGEGLNANRIYWIEPNGERSLVFDREKMDASLEQLLQQASDSLCQEIVQACQDPCLENKPICALLLEYTMQGPFPPTFALVQTTERDAGINNGERPLSWLNAPDCEFFSEDENPPLETENDSLYNAINAHIENLIEAAEDFDEDEDSSEGAFSLAEDMIVDFYVELCKKLRLRVMQVPQLSLESDFFVTARDFEACNDERYLEALWPEKRWQQFVAETDSYHQAHKEANRGNPDFVHYQKTMAEVEQRIPQLLAEAMESCEELRYSDELLFSLRPFHRQLALSHLDGELDDYYLPEPPSENSAYHQYGLQDGLVRQIAFWSGGKLIKRWFVHYGEQRDQMIQIHLSEPSVEEVQILEKSAASEPLRYREYCIVSEREEFECDELGRIVKIIRHSFYPDHIDEPFAFSQEPFVYHIDYVGEEVGRIAVEDRYEESGWNVRYQRES